MGKLHEILAVERSKKSQAEKFLTEAKKAFKNSSLFTGFIRRYTPKHDDGTKFPDEYKNMVTSVPDKLDYTLSGEANYLDVLLQKELANTSAKAKIEIDGLDLPELPATLLLNMETRLKSLRDVLDAAPTLDAAIQWVWDADQQCFRAAPVETIKTKKTLKNHVVAEATDKHPAQVQVYNEDVPIGTWTTTNFSGELTSRQKMEVLTRLDNLISEVKKARQRANLQEVPSDKMGEDIMSYILEPLKQTNT